MKDISYDELIIRLRKNDEEASELLFLLLENYMRFLSKKMINSCRLINHSVEELMLIGRKITNDSIFGYEFDKSIFFAYWKMVITRKMKDIQNIHENENKIEYEKISLDDDLLKYKYFDKSQIVVMDTYSQNEIFNQSVQQIDNKFGPDTTKILSLWAEGMTYIEISKKLKISLSKVNYEISKAIKYLKSFFSNK